MIHLVDAHKLDAFISQTLPVAQLEAINSLEKLVENIRRDKGKNRLVKIN